VPTTGSSAFVVAVLAAVAFDRQTAALYDARPEHHGGLVLAVQRGAVDGERLAAIARVAGPPRLERSSRLVGGERPGIEEVLDACAAQAGGTEHVAIVLADGGAATGRAYRAVAGVDR
jgi:hypothetical protein